MALARRIRATARDALRAPAAPPPPRTAADYGLTVDAAAAIAAAFPNRISSAVARHIDITIDITTPSDVLPLAQAILIETHRLLRKASADGDDTRFRFKRFNLFVRMRARFPDGPPERQGWGWISTDLGAFTRGELTEAEPLRKELYDFLLSHVEHYGELVDISTYRCTLGDIEWNVRGACKSTRATIRDAVSGVLFAQFKSKAGNCGPTCLLRGMRAMLSQLDPVVFRNWNSVGKMRNGTSVKFPELEADRSMAWSPAMLSYAGSALNVNVIVYDLADLLGEPIYGSENTIALAVIRVIWCAPTSIYSDGESGHYLLMLDMHSTCDKCGEDVDRWNLNKNRPIIHRCAKTCPQCNVVVKGSTSKHRCLQSINDEKESLEAELLLPPTATEQRRIDEVELIMRGVDDAPVLLAWHESMDSGSSTCLLGDAGSGKTYAVKQHVVEWITTHPPKSIAIIGAEAVGVSPYCDCGVWVSTIHSFLSIQVGRDPIKHATKLVDAQRPTDAQMVVLQRLRDLEVLVVDEVGACPNKLLSTLDVVMQMVRDDARDFGGVRIIFIGDFRQRGPVANGTDGPIFMGALWARMNLNYFVLRQDRRITGVDVDDLAFSTCLKKMSRGVLSRNELAWLNLKCQVTADSLVHFDPEVIHLMNTNQQVYDKGHEQVLKFFGAAVTRYHILAGNGQGLTSGEMRVYDAELILGMGCPVMFTTNLQIKCPGSPRNGTRGKVCSLEADSIDVLLDSGHVITVKRRSIGKGRGSQFPLRNAYAGTIAKSQGATLLKVCLWPPTASVRLKGNEALMYVGCSRVRGVRNLSFASRLWNTNIRYCALSVLFMDLIQHQPYNVVVERLYRYQCQGEDAAMQLYPINMFQVCRTVCVNDKSVFDGTLPMYSRAQVERMVEQKENMVKVDGKKNFYVGNFSNVIYMDFETSPVGELQLLQPYAVYANYWMDYKIANTLDYGVVAEGGVQPDCLAKFVSWMMDDIVMPRCEEWVQSGYKECKGSTRIVAWNGSRFDFLFIFKYLLSDGRWDGMHYDTTIKGGQIMSLRCEYFHGGQTKEAFVFWDPCLIVTSSLDKAHSSYCAEAHQSLSKDCFPHLYVNRVGATAAFNTPVAVELDIEQDFPAGMWKVVQSRISAGDLQCGSAPGTVLFNPVLEARQYVQKDVIMLEGVTEGLSMMCWNEVLPDMNVPIFRFITASSYGFYCTMVLLEDTVKDDQTYRTNLHRLSYRQDQILREGVYGGKTLPRALAYAAEGSAALITKHEEKQLEDPDYCCVEDYDKANGAFYLDLVGMYHWLCKDRCYPYGPHMELLIVSFVEQFFKQFIADPESDTFPMFFMRLDVMPNKYDIEPCLPSKDKKGGRLLWHNKDKKQQVYSSVHLKMALKRGYQLSNPTWVLLWGKQDATNGQWVGSKKRMFEASSNKWLEMRLKGGAHKDTGKGLANTTFGATLKRDFLTDTQIYEGKRGEGASPQLHEYTMRLRDPRWKSTYQQAFMRDEETAVLMTKWEAQIDEDEFTCSRCSYIGAFILAYAHDAIDTAIEAMLGDRRRDGSVTWQILNGDTDSLMVDIRCCNNQNLQFSSTELGAFNDDLKDLWKAPKKIECNADGRPRFVKILSMVNPAKKFYSIKCITPEGRVVTVKPKSKGIAKGAQTHMMTGVQKRKLHSDLEYDAKRARTGPREERKVEQNKLSEFYSAQKFTSALQYNDLDTMIHRPEEDGLVVSSISMKKHGVAVPPHLLRAGVLPFSIQNIVMTRHVMSGGAKFPPERIRIETPEDVNTIWSVPDGWEKHPAAP